MLAELSPDPNVFTLCQWGPAARMKRSKLTVERRIELARRHAAGEDVNALSKAFQVSVRQVSKIAKCGSLPVG